MIDINGKFWGLIVTLLIAFPPSLSRTLTALRYAFLLGIVCVFYMMLTIIIEFFVKNSNTYGMSYK